MRICRLIFMSLVLLCAAPTLVAASGAVEASGSHSTSPWRVSTHFRVQTLGVEPSQRLEREVIQTMEKWYRLLMVAFEDEPQDPIAVHLHTRESFHRDTGAPHWANGVFSEQGRIHAAIGGVARVEPDLERRLAHELAHAFISGLSAGVAPRWLQEGLAQALSDHRPPATLTWEAMSAKSLGDLGYRETLAFARHLMAVHGQAALRDTLATMGAGIGVDEAFQIHTGASPADQFDRWRGDGQAIARNDDRENSR